MANVAVGYNVGAAKKLMENIKNEYSGHYKFKNIKS